MEKLVLVRTDVPPKRRNLQQEKRARNIPEDGILQKLTLIEWVTGA
jgi:hypothetical protein